MSMHAAITQKIILLCVFLIIKIAMMQSNYNLTLSHVKHGYTKRAALCDCMSHVHVQYGHTCPLTYVSIAINSTYRSKIASHCISKCVNVSALDIKSI